MDPDAALARLEALSKEIDQFDHRPDSSWHTIAALAEEMAQVFDGLNGWLRQGGHRPSAWQR